MKPKPYPMNDESYIKPFLKWAGGKRRLLPEIRKRLPEDIKDCLYCEPFIGGGAVLLDLQPKRAIINDCNCELINCFQMVKQSPEKLVKGVRDIRKHPGVLYLNSLTGPATGTSCAYRHPTGGTHHLPEPNLFQRFVQSKQSGIFQHTVRTVQTSGYRQQAGDNGCQRISQHCKREDCLRRLFHRPEAAAFRCVCLSGSSIPSRQVHRSPPIPLKDGTRKTSFVLGTLAGLWIKEVSVF